MVTTLTVSLVSHTVECSIGKALLESALNVLLLLWPPCPVLGKLEKGFEIKPCMEYAALPPPQKQAKMDLLQDSGPLEAGGCHV